MHKSPLTWLTWGSFPLSSVLLISGGFYLIGSGHSQADSQVKFAIAERQALVLEAILNKPDLSPEEREKAIAAPIRAVLEKYQAQGFVVLDAVKSDDGGYAVTALPSDTIDITPELRAAVTTAARTENHE